MGMPDVEVQVYSWLGRTPWVLVAVAGLVLCMVFLGRYPRQCLMIGGALVIQFTMSAVAPFITQFVFSMFDAGDMDELKWRVLINSAIYSVPAALALGLILWVAFEPMWRGNSPDEPDR